MSLEVIDASGLVTVQDAGRKGWRQFGVPGSGPMDTFAFQAANALVGNPIEYAAIEIGLGDVTFQAIQDCVIAITRCRKARGRLVASTAPMPSAE